MKITSTLVMITALVILSSPTNAADMNDSVLMSFNPTGKMTTDWKAVTKCAETPYPKLPKQALLYRFFELRLHNINSCRLALSSRQEGWIDSGRNISDNPWPPAKMIRDDDFKLDFDWEAWVK